MARHRARILATRPAPRSNVWVALRIDQTTFLSGIPALVATLNAAALALRPFTIVRTWALLNVASDQVAASEFVQGALGFQVVTETAAAAGIASLPTPLIETDADYFVYQPFASSFLFGSAIGFQEEGGAGNNWVIDSKSMRKVGVDDDLAITIENRGPGYLAAIEGRMLVKLH